MHTMSRAVACQVFDVLGFNSLGLVGQRRFLSLKLSLTLPPT